MWDQQRLRPACAYTQSDQSLCKLLEESMTVKLVTKQHLEFPSLKRGCTGSPDFTLVNMPHCLKSHVTAHLCCFFQNVGCDGIVGSTQQKDHCGVCGGDNDSCRIIAGIYTRTHHRYGYQQITQIPKGACHVNVTELARSRNYLGELLR